MRFWKVIKEWFKPKDTDRLHDEIMRGPHFGEIPTTEPGGLGQPEDLHTNINSALSKSTLFNEGRAGSLETWLDHEGKFIHFSFVQDPGKPVAFYLDGVQADLVPRRTEPGGLGQPLYHDRLAHAESVVNERIAELRGEHRTTPRTAPSPVRQAVWPFGAPETKQDQCLLARGEIHRHSRLCDVCGMGPCPRGRWDSAAAPDASPTGDEFVRQMSYSAPAPAPEPEFKSGGGGDFGGGGASGSWDSGSSSSDSSSSSSTD